MTRILLILAFAFVSLGIGVFKGYKLLHPAPAPSVAAATKLKPELVHADPEVKAKREERSRGAFDIKAEQFRGVSQGVLRTDQRSYEIGEMCALGMVQAIRNHVVRIIQPDGRTLYLCAEDNINGPDREEGARDPSRLHSVAKSFPQLTAAPTERQVLASALPVATATPTVTATLEAPTPSLGERESARMRANLRSSTRIQAFTPSPY